MRFEIVAGAPEVQPDITLSSFEDLRDVLQGAVVICESLQDNDIERWFWTRGGQFVRETGETGGRFYVFPDGEALEMLAGMAEDAIVSELRAAVAGKGRQVSPGPS